MRLLGVRAGALIAALLVLAGCATQPSRAADRGRLRVVAAENFWGSLASQLGGSQVEVTSIIANPDADPHDYEPTAADARRVAAADVVLVNGVGYDTWAGKLAAANPSDRRTLLDVGKLAGVPADGNPHRWYDPADVRQVIDQLTADYVAHDPAHAGFYHDRHDALVGTGLRPYFDLIAQIRADSQGTPTGASESIFAMLAPALGLDLVTPPSFLAAISEGGDPTPADKATIDAQIGKKEIKVYVYNSQNATPDVQAQVNAARAAGIPVTTITETLTPAGASFQDWQVTQLTALRQALQEGADR